MRDRGTETKERKEQFFYKQYAMEQRTMKSAPAQKRTHIAAQEEPTRQSAAFFKKSKTNEHDTVHHANSQMETAQASRIQRPRETESCLKLYRKSLVKKRGQRKIAIFSCAVFAVLTLTIVLIACFCGASDADVLKGTWNLDGVTVYQFDGKGAGSLNLPNNSYAFTYEINNGSLFINFENEKARDKTYAFTIEKDTLTLKSNEGSDSKIFELTKRKD